jgi:hypothetical protein
MTGCQVPDYVNGGFAAGAKMVISRGLFINTADGIPLNNGAEHALSCD